RPVSTRSASIDSWHTTRLGRSRSRSTRATSTSPASATAPTSAREASLADIDLDPIGLEPALDLDDLLEGRVVRRRALRSRRLGLSGQACDVEVRAHRRVRVPEDLQEALADAFAVGRMRRSRIRALPPVEHVVRQDVVQRAPQHALLDIAGGLLVPGHVPY